MVAAFPRWQKLGRIFAPERFADGRRPWLVSHASNPVGVPLDDDRVRVYFSSRDAERRSCVAWFEFLLDAPLQPTRVADAPVVQHGEPGLFDDSGTSLGCVVRHGDRTLLYYVGWNLGVTVPWRNSIGLAIGDADGLRFDKHGRAPVLDRSDVDPFSLSYPWVLHDGGRFRMWYGSNLTWGPTIASMTHVIRYAESADGVHWRAHHEPAIALAGGDETALARPCVLRDDDGYRMWFNHRGAAYRLGCAWSSDGACWQRRDAEAGLDVRADSDAGVFDTDSFDTDMVCYPNVFRARGRRYMLYNGNGYGASGIGLAVARDE